MAFDPFFTTKDAGNHVGLGLNKIKNFLDQCDAMLVMGTEIEKGTTARLIFPAFEEPESPEKPRRARRKSYSARPDPKRTVLVVSRDAEARKVRARLIVSLGQNAPVASTADEALDQVAENAMIDLVLVDADFSPNLSGRELAEQVHALRPDIKILFATTGAELDDLKM